MIIRCLPSLYLFNHPSCNSTIKHSKLEAARCFQRIYDDDDDDETPPCSSTPFCSCVTTRRHLLLQTMSSTALFPIAPSFASPNHSTAMLNKIHPPRPEWYDELYAFVMENGMKSYEEEISSYKTQLFSKMKGNAHTVLEIGIGTGPNLKYYANETTGVQVFGVDPNKKMDEYARTAAYKAGVLPSNFMFVQAVVEALPFADASVDAVVGTLVLCSVKDVDLALNEVIRVLKPGGYYVFVEHVAAQDGSARRIIQGVLDPLQQIVADGCHLTRETGKAIANAAGFSSVDMQQVFVSNASIINPHVYGIAYK